MPETSIINTAYRSSYNAELAQRESFKSILGDLSGLRKKVFECLLHFGPLSNEEIAFKIGIKVQSVCGRVHELRGNLYDIDLKKTVLKEDKVFVVFAEYVDKNNKKKGVRWKVTDAALKLEPELEF